MVEAMWSRPIRIALANSRLRFIVGEAPRSSHTTEAWVIVTSLRTPRPAMMTAATSSSWRLISPANVERIRPPSSTTPVRCAELTDHQPIPAVSAIPVRVPASAALVRRDGPWVVYRTTYMITAEATRATGTAGWPASMAGITKTPTTAPANPSPIRAISPRSRATARTTTTNSPPTSQSEVDRSISK